MRLLLPLCLALAACGNSQPPNPLDADNTIRDASKIDGAPLDQGVTDAGADVPAEASGMDAVAVADVAPVDAVDAQAADAGSDAVAVGDVQDVPGLDVAMDVQLVDAVDVTVPDAPTATDAPGDAGADVVDVPAPDVPRDVGPVDGGPVVYDLAAARTTLEVHALMHGTYASGSTRDCADVASSSCSVTGGVLDFSANACSGVSFTGRLLLGDAGPSTLSIFGGGGGSSATTLRFATGARVGAHRSFHVQFSAPVFQGEPGFSGIPGRTVDPALADLWLLGCASD